MSDASPVIDPRLEQATLRLLDVIKVKPAAAKEATSSLNETVRYLSGEVFGVSEAVEQEHHSIQCRVKCFDKTTSRAYREFEQRGLAKRKVVELVAICEVLSLAANVTMDRESKRRVPLMYQWLDKNWAQLEPSLRQVVLVYANGKEQPLG
jgi:hypothetical protein